mmetsp:Transcript_81016/g.203959  ORF Transcript_81016/g.203959 Transcript_81016/m.203959 type:complete len:271 (-) Transcript_81016:833-1645(-)
MVPHHLQEVGPRFLAVERLAVGSGVLVCERPRYLLAHASPADATRSPDVVDKLLLRGFHLVGDLGCVVVLARCADAGQARVRGRFAALLRSLQSVRHLPRVAGHAPRVCLWDRDGTHLHPHVDERRRGWGAGHGRHSAPRAGPQTRALLLPLRLLLGLPRVRSARRPRRQGWLPRERGVLPQWRDLACDVADACGRLPRRGPHGPIPLPEQSFQDAGAHLLRSVPHPVQRVGHREWLIPERARDGVSEGRFPLCAVRVVLHHGALGHPCG